jgi:competence protein ComGC
MENRNLIILAVIIAVLFMGGYLWFSNQNTGKAPVGTTSQLTDDAKLRECQANLMTIEAAASAYQATRNEAPASIAALVESGLLRTRPICASGGDYSLDSDGGASCSVNGKLPGR